MLSILVLFCGILFPKMIPRRSIVAPPPSKVYDVDAMSQTAQPTDREFPIDDLGPSTVLPEFQFAPEDEAAGAEADET